MQLGCKSVINCCVSHGLQLLKSTFHTRLKQGQLDGAWERGRYVWNLEGAKWQATLVILRLNRAALVAEWSPQGTP